MTVALHIEDITMGRSSTAKPLLSPRQATALVAHAAALEAIADTSITIAESLLALLMPTVRERREPDRMKIAWSL